MGRPQGVPELQPGPGAWTRADGPLRQQTRQQLLQRALTAPPLSHQQPHTHRHRQPTDMAHPRAPTPATLRPEGCPILDRNSPAQRNKSIGLRSVSCLLRVSIACLSPVIPKPGYQHVLNCPLIVQRHVYLLVETTLPLSCYPHVGLKG